AARLLPCVAHDAGSNFAHVRPLRLRQKFAAFEPRTTASPQTVLRPASTPRETAGDAFGRSVSWLAGRRRLGRPSRTHGRRRPRFPVAMVWPRARRSQLRGQPRNCTAFPVTPVFEGSPPQGKSSGRPSAESTGAHAPTPL